jgi:maleylacetate reductase
MRDFVHSALPMRVAFGAGRSAALADELDHLGLRRVLVLSTPEQRDLAERIAEQLGERAAGVHAEARMHVPVDVADRAVDVAAVHGADGCVAVGGGSTVGLGKIIALRSGLPVVALPTTYAGSEMTPVWGLTENEVKRTGKDPVVLPRSVVYDPELTLSLPVPTSVTSGVNAIAHAVEALYAPDGSPIVSLMAEEAVRAMASALPRIVADPTDPEGRSEALYAAWLAGACLGATTMGLHHKLCHVLGGTLGLPHSETHTVLLPYVWAFNAPAAPAAAAALDRALGAEPLGERLRAVGAPRALSELGAKREDLARVIDQAVDAPYSNPRRVTRDALTALLDAAYDGAPPREDPHA